MKSRKKLTIVIPVYNAEAHVERMDGYLAAQKCRDFEAIFVDDASQDATLSRLEGALSAGRYAARVLKRPHGGVSAARNAGMAAATGEWVAFADVDDALAPDYVETMLSFASREATLLRHTRVVNGAPRFEAGTGRRETLPPQALLEEFLRDPTAMGVYDLVICREFLEKSGVRFPEGYAYYEDYDFILRLFAACSAVLRGDAARYCYCASPNSAMNSFNMERIRCLQLFDNTCSLYLVNMVDLCKRFEKWFAARLFWSTLWQACVAMPPQRALSFARENHAREHMRRLTDYPDRRVSLSARMYLMWPQMYVIIARRMGRWRTLLTRENEK